MPVFLIFSAALMFGLYNVFIKMSAGHINAVLGAVVLQFVAAFLGLGLLLYQQAGNATPLQFNRAGLGLAVAAGLAIGLVEILTFVIYGRGVPVACPWRWVTRLLLVALYWSPLLWALCC